MRAIFAAGESVIDHTVAGASREAGLKSVGNYLWSIT